MLKHRKLEEFAHDMLAIGCILYTLCSGDSVLDISKTLNNLENINTGIDVYDLPDVSKQGTF